MNVATWVRPPQEKLLHLFPTNYHPHSVLVDSFCQEHWITLEPHRESYSPSGLVCPDCRATAEKRGHWL